MGISLKRMRPGDEGDFDSIAPDVFDEPIHPERLEAYLLEVNHLMILAIEDGVVVGQCAAVLHRHPDKPIELYIDEVGTASTHRRLGIGKRLLDAMFVWGRELGCREAWLGTEHDNAAANGLYRKAGGRHDAIMSYEFDL